MTRRDTPSQSPHMRFTFKCVDCGAKNEVQRAKLSEDCMYYCPRCGFDTVQVLHSVKKIRRAA